MKRNRDRFDGLSGNRRLPLDANDGSCKDHSLPREPSAEIGRALQKLESAQSAGEPEGGRSAPEQDREKTPQLVQVHPESVPGLQAVRRQQQSRKQTPTTSPQYAETSKRLLGGQPETCQPTRQRPTHVVTDVTNTLWISVRATKSGITRGR